MPMTREEQDAFDRKMAGINTPGAYGEGMAALDRAVGNPIASYSLDDLRRMFLRGSAAPVATPGAMPAETKAMSPSLPTDALRGPALPGPVERMTEFEISPPNRAPSAAPMAPPPVPPPAPRAAMPTGTRPTAPVMPPPPAPPVAAPVANRVAGDFMPFETPATLPGVGRISPADNIPRPMLPPGFEAPGTLPGEAATAPVRLNPEQLARALQRYGKMELDPNSFSARLARTQR